MHLLFFLFFLFCFFFTIDVIDLTHHCYRTSPFIFWGSVALTSCFWRLNIKYCFGRKASEWFLFRALTWRGKFGELAGKHSCQKVRRNFCLQTPVDQSTKLTGSSLRQRVAGRPHISQPQALFTNMRFTSTAQRLMHDDNKVLQNFKKWYKSKCFILFLLFNVGLQSNWFGCDSGSFSMDFEATLFPSDPILFPPMKSLTETHFRSLCGPTSQSVAYRRWYFTIGPTKTASV